MQTVAIEQGYNFARAVMETHPEIGDRIDADGMADAYFERIGFPPEAVRSVTDSDALRQQRAEAQKVQQALDMAGQAAAAAKDASASGLGEANVLTQMMGQAA